MQKLIRSSFLFMTLIVSTSLWATEVHISYNNFQSTLTISSKLISYKDTNTYLTIQTRKCSDHIIARVKKSFDLQSRNLFHEKVEDHPMTLILDKAKYVIDERSPKGQYFHHFIEVIKEAKIEEMLNCR